jgi:hypothetical protein
VQLPDAAVLPPWMSAWGFGSLLLGGLALMTALFLSPRWLPLVLAGLGVATVAVGVVKTGKKGNANDGLWLAAGGILSLVVLGLTLIAPGILNRYWAMDEAVARPDPQQLVALSDRLDDKGRTLAPTDTADAVTESIGQDGVSLRIMSVGIGAIEGKGAKQLLLVRVRVSSAGYQQAITFEGFSTDKHRPTLKGAGGEPYAFLEQRARKLPAGGVVFLAAAAQPVAIPPTRFLDYQLVFEPPPAEFPALILELPASAWGRKGVCRFRIDRFFEPNFPSAKKD